SWAGGAAGHWIIDPDLNNYYAVSLVNGRRRQEDFEALIVLGADDVGVKVDGDTLRGLLGDPTYRIETSPGNEHWGDALAAPVSELGEANALITALAQALGRNDAKDVTRYLRLPVGRNLKASAGGFRCRMLEWAPERKLTDPMVRMGMSPSGGSNSNSK